MAIGRAASHGIQPSYVIGIVMYENSMLMKNRHRPMRRIFRASAHVDPARPNLRCAA